MKYLTQKGLRILNEIKAPSIRGTLAAAAARVGTKAINSSPKVSGRQDSPPKARKVPMIGTKFAVDKGRPMLPFGAPLPRSVADYEPKTNTKVGGKIPLTGGGSLQGINIANKKTKESPWAALNKVPGGMVGGGTLHTAADTGGNMFKGATQTFTGGSPQTWSAERKKGLPGRMGTNLALGSKGSKHPSQTRSGDFLPDYEDLKSSKSGKGYMLGRMGLGDVEGGLADLSLPGGRPHKDPRYASNDKVYQQRLYSKPYDSGPGDPSVPWYPGRAASKKTWQRDKGEQAEWNAKYKDWREHVKDPEEERRMGVMRQKMRRMKAAAKKSKIEREGTGIKFDR